MKSQGMAGRRTSQPTKIFQLKYRLEVCKTCEVCTSDRKYSPKSEPVILTSSLFVMEGGL